MYYKYEFESSETYQLKRQLEHIIAELEMYKCYKAANDVRIKKLKEAQRRAHMPFKGTIE